MGLDICHFCIVPGNTGEPLILDDVPGLETLKNKFSHVIRSVDHEIVDWPKMFAKRKLTYSAYTAGPHTVLTRFGIRGPKSADYYGFMRKEHGGALPKLIIFTNDGILQAWFGGMNHGLKAILAIAGSKRIDATYRGSFCKTTQSKLALRTKRVGYQRAAVSDAFFNEFAPVEYITDLDRVRRIHALTVDSNKSSFQSEFLDSWDPQRSFVLVWY